MLVKAVSVQHLRAYSSFRTGSVLRPCCTDAPPWPHASQSLIFYWMKIINKVNKISQILFKYVFYYKYIYFKCHALLSKN